MKTEASSLMSVVRLAVIAAGAIAGTYPAELQAQVPELSVTEIQRFPFDEDAPFARVSRLRQGPDGHLYVTEMGAFGVKGVLVFDQEGHFIRQIGRGGEGPGEFRQLASLGWHGDTLWVLDDALYRVSEFTLGGEFLGSWRFEPLREGWGESRWDARGILAGHGVVFLERSAGCSERSGLGVTSPSREFGEVGHPRSRRQAISFRHPAIFDHPDGYR
jgi:6-bladed beta-propeller